MNYSISDAGGMKSAVFSNGGGVSGFYCEYFPIIIFAEPFSEITGLLYFP